MSIKHTPGPWYLNISPASCSGVCVSWRIDTASRVSIAYGQSQEHLGNSGIQEDECSANARLIAAAPELIQALYEVLDFVEGQEDVVDGSYGAPVANAAMQLASTVREAISKAIGGQA